MARLGELERRVMDVLWASMGEDLTVREVAVELPNHAYTTVLTVLDRLQRKRMVTRTKDGRAHRYRAAASRAVYTAELMHEALGAVPDRNAALVHFAETVTSDEAGVLRQALQDLEESRPSTPPSAAHGTRG